MFPGFFLVGQSDAEESPTPCEWEVGRLPINGATTTEMSVGFRLQRYIRKVVLEGGWKLNEWGGDN